MHPETSLENGLALLKVGDFPMAIASFEAVTAQDRNSPLAVKAQVGLVVAYARNEQITEAIALCEKLTLSSDPEIKTWADKTLEKLIKHVPSTPATKDETGFIPLENSLPPPPPLPPWEKNKITSKTESTKFVPLDDRPNPDPESNDLVLLDKSTPANTAPTQPVSTTWRKAPRAKSWQPLPKIDLKPLWLLTAGTSVALYFVVLILLRFVLSSINALLVKLPFLEPIQLFYRDPSLFLVTTLLLLAYGTPWLLDILLKRFYGKRDLIMEDLKDYSPESIRVLQRFCQQRNWRFPELGILPIDAPIALCYGNHPRTARIVVSQGLLSQLADDEIAAIYAGQLGHIANWEFTVMSLVLLVTLPLHRLYQKFSRWGDLTDIKIFRAIAVVLSSITYGIWCLLTGTSIWLSQLRHYYCDRTAAEITGNPNALTRALLKIALGIARDVEKQQQISNALESLNILAPVGYQQSLSNGSFTPELSLSSLLMWDYLNPYRWYFVINNTHPLFGDRLQRLASIARAWYLETELDLEKQPSLRIKRQSFMLQIAPFLGMVAGLAFAGLIKLLWYLAYTLKVLNLKWIYDDNWWYAFGCVLIGFSLGILVRINSFFPELKEENLHAEETLPNLLNNPTALPIDGRAVRIVGKLLGRRGTSNCLGQDLILQSRLGLLKLHVIPWLGQPIKPQDLVGRQIAVTGWFRRGATPWIDIQTLQTQTGKTIASPHPIWSTVIAVACEAWGAYILLTG